MNYTVTGPLVTNVRSDVSPKKSLAFTGIKSENLRLFEALRTDIPRNETLGAPQFSIVLFLVILILFALRKNGLFSEE